MELLHGTTKEYLSQAVAEIKDDILRPENWKINENNLGLIIVDKNTKE